MSLEALEVQNRLLKAENEKLVAAIEAIGEAQRHKISSDIYQEVKQRLVNWGQLLLAYALVLMTVVGLTSYREVKQAAIDKFQAVTQPGLLDEFKRQVIPPLEADIRSEATYETERITSSLTEQFNAQLQQLTAQFQQLTKSASTAPPTQPNRPTDGYVPERYLKARGDGKYQVDSYRLNVRAKPNGEILGRQIQGAVVRILERDGDWARIAVEK